MRNEAAKHTSHDGRHYAEACSTASARSYFRQKEESVAADLESIGSCLVTFSHIYESTDSALCLFEDREGHLIAVPTWRLA